MPSEAIGLSAASGAVLLFGSFPLATKWTPTGDGLVFQWCMCAGIFTVGMITHFVQCATGHNAGIDAHAPTCPQFIPFASLGGFIWCSSNVLLVPLVDCIGIGLSMLAWGMCEMLTGFFTGKFGLGVNKELVAYPGFNVGGVLFAVASLLVLLQIRPNTVDDTAAAGEENDSASSERDFDHAPSAEAPLIEVDLDGHNRQQSAVARIFSSSGSSAAGQSGSDNSTGGLHAGLLPESIFDDEANKGKLSPVISNPNEDSKWTDALSPSQKRLFGVCGCVVAGVMSGSTFTAPQHVVDSQANWIAGGSVGPAPYPGASTQLFDLLFSHFVGIMMTSTVYVMAYAALKRNKPQVYAESLLPAYVSGLGAWRCEEEGRHFNIHQ